MKDWDYDQYDQEDIENEYLNTFYRLVHSGELPAIRIGKLWRVKREALLKLEK